MDDEEGSLNRDELAERRADLKLREVSEHDHTRSRRPVSATGGAWPPVIATHWSCRVKSCRVPVPITDDAVFALRVNNDELTRRGEARISTEDVAYCPVHAAEVHRMRIDWNTQIRAKVRDAIIELKSDPPPHPERERDLLEKLEALGHPDVKGLVVWLTEARKKGKARRGA